MVGGALLGTALGGWGLTLGTDAAEAKKRRRRRRLPPPPPPSSDVRVQGAFVAGSQGDPTKLDAFVAVTGTPPKAVGMYSQWASQWTSKFSSLEPLINKARSYGAAPIVTWEPWVPGQGPSQPAYSLKQIVAGAHDAYIKEWAEAARADGRSIYLRPIHEMNGAWYPWCVGVNGNTSADYVAAWSYLHDIFEQQGANNVRWVWSPGVNSSFGTPFREFYPGDAYVDWVGLDGYNWGTSQAWSKWETFTQNFRGAYDTISEFTDKPVMVAETGSAEEGGDKAAWIEAAYLVETPQGFPQVRAIIWFHENKEADWRVDSSQAALNAYRKVVSSSIYQGQLR